MATISGKNVEGVKFQTSFPSMERYWNEKDEGGKLTLKEGDYIAGIFHGSKHGLGEYNKSLHCIDVDGDLVGVWGGTVLDKRLTTKHIGEPVKIVFNGESVSKTGQTYKNYTVLWEEGKGDESTTQEAPKEELPSINLDEL